MGRCADESEVEQAARARLQGGGLLQADMAAFKAANPACQLADFVRWHSPKDWHPNPSHPQGGMLSDRMSHQVSQHRRNTDWQQVSAALRITADFHAGSNALCMGGASIARQLYSFAPCLLLRLLLLCAHMCKHGSLTHRGLAAPDVNASCVTVSRTCIK